MMTRAIERRHKWQMLKAAAYVERHLQGRVPSPPELLQLIRPPAATREFIAQATKVRMGNVRYPAGPRHVEHFCNAVQSCLSGGKLVRVVQGLHYPPESIA
jgi:hypothetical protein